MKQVTDVDETEKVDDEIVAEDPDEVAQAKTSEKLLDGSSVGRCAPQSARQTRKRRTRCSGRGSHAPGVTPRASGVSSTMHEGRENRSA
jgi:hypothetical protein